MQGREEGDKDRPALVIAIVTTSASGVPVVRVLPVTHTPPSNPDLAVEIPAATKRRLGLDDVPSWIVLTESNRFVWPGPDIRPVDTESGYYGALPPALFKEVREKFVATVKDQRHKATSRSI